MPNHPPLDNGHDHPADPMTGDQWEADTSNYRLVGMAIASFNNLIGTDPFMGTAEMKVEGGVRHLEIHLYHDQEEGYRCLICNLIPPNHTENDPALCTFCGLKVCSRCWKAHEKGHWRPQKTLAGDIMCDGETVKCGKDQCPTCGGAPF